MQGIRKNFLLSFVNLFCFDLYRMVQKEKEKKEPKKRIKKDK
jgi:hypothetical protein